MDEPRPVTRAVHQGVARLLPDLDRERAWLLTVDDAPQSYVDLDDPGHLEFEYVRRIAHVLHTAFPDGPLDLLHLGGGALTLARQVAAVRPGSGQRVAEFDAALIDLVDEWLPVPADAGIEVRALDARAVLESAGPGTLDAVVADVFGGSRVPAHLTTVECAGAAARALRPAGVYVANVADAAPFGFVRSQLANLTEVFAQVCLLAEPAVLRGRRFGNLVLAASAEPLPVDGLARRCAADPFPARVVHGARLRRLIDGAAPVHDGAAAPSPVPPDGSFSLS